MIVWQKFPTLKFFSNRLSRAKIANWRFSRFNMKILFSLKHSILFLIIWFWIFHMWSSSSFSWIVIASKILKIFKSSEKFCDLWKIRIFLFRNFHKFNFSHSFQWNRSERQDVNIFFVLTQVKTFSVLFFGWKILNSIKRSQKRVKSFPIKALKIKFRL